MRIVIGADHRGYALKEQLKTQLISLGHEVHDVGAHSHNTDDDYPDFADAAAQEVIGSAGSLGVLLCGSGMGMDMVANKTKGIRATIVTSRDAAIYARDHDNINVITLAADFLNDEQALDIVQAYIATPFSGIEKHARRLAKLDAIEERTMR